MPILEVKNLYKNFGSTKVLKDISFSLERGKALAIIGSSGSGKTTLLRCLNFLETPNEGQIIVNGEPLFDAADHAAKSDAEIRRSRLHFGMVFQSFNLFPQYTALENVTLAGKLLARDFDNEFMTMTQASQVRFTFPKKTAWTLDGEYGGESQNVIIQNHQKALQIRTGN
mgnify:CR=1 FL=1